MERYRREGVGVRGRELPQVSQEGTILWTGKGTDH